MKRLKANGLGLSGLGAAGLVFALLMLSSAQAQDSGFFDSSSSLDSSESLLTVHKSPTCGCCEGWIEHLEERGIQAEISHPEDLNAVKDQLQIPVATRSCHTGVSERGFVFEGHIPARFIEQFLANPPEESLGLAVAGMPIGSPGMEMGERFTPYEVLLLKLDGSTEVYATVDNAESQY